MRIPYFRQRRVWSCGPVCAHMILAGFGIRTSRIALIRECRAKPEYGTHRSDLTRCLRMHGVTATPDPRGTLAKLRSILRRGDVAIINYVEPADDEGHYAIVTAMSGSAFLLHDPWNGEHFRVTEAQMKSRWLGHKTASKQHGWMLVIEVPTSRSAERTVGRRPRR